MKKIALLFIALCFNTVALAETSFVEGKHYKEFAKKSNEPANVTEFFSFFCGHCYKFEFIAKAIEKELPEGVPFKKSHVDFLGGRPRELQTALSAAMVVAEELKVGHKLKDAIFNYIHKQRATFNNIDDVRKLFALHGIDGAKFDQKMKSEAVQAAVHNMVRAQTDMSNIGVLTGVPTVIVNNRYKVNTGEMRSMEEYHALIKYLINKKD